MSQPAPGVGDLGDLRTRGWLQPPVSTFAIKKKEKTTLLNSRPPQAADNLMESYTVPPPPSPHACNPLPLPRLIPLILQPPPPLGLSLSGLSAPAPKKKSLAGGRGSNARGGGFEPMAAVVEAAAGEAGGLPPAAAAMAAAGAEEGGASETGAGPSEKLGELWREARALCARGQDGEAAQALRAAAALAPSEAGGGDEGGEIAQALEAQAAKLDARAAARAALDKAAAEADAAREKELAGPPGANTPAGADGAGGVDELQAAAEERERPPGASAAAARAAEAITAGDLRAAQALLAEAVRLDPDFYQCHAQLAALGSARGDDRLALGGLLRAVRAEPGFLKGHLGAAEVLNRRGFFPEAEGEYLVTVQKNFSCSEAWAGLSLLLFRQGRVSEAVARLRLAMSGGPLGKHKEPQTDPRVLLALAFILGAQGYLAEPCSALMLCCQRAQSLIPTFLLSRFAQAVGDRHLARSASSQALSFLPVSSPTGAQGDLDGAAADEGAQELFLKEAAWCDAHLALPLWEGALSGAMRALGSSHGPQTYSLPRDMDALREAALNASRREGEDGNTSWVLQRGQALSWDRRRVSFSTFDIVEAAEAALDIQDMQELLLDLGVDAGGAANPEPSSAASPLGDATICVQKVLAQPLLVGDMRAAFAVHFLVAALPASEFSGGGCPPVGGNDSGDRNSETGDRFLAYVCRRSVATVCSLPFDHEHSSSYPGDLADSIHASAGPKGPESLRLPEALRQDAAEWVRDEFPELDWTDALSCAHEACAAVVAAGCPGAPSGAPPGALTLGLPKFIGCSFIFDSEKQIPQLVAVDPRPPLQVGGQPIWSDAPAEVWRWVLGESEPGQSEAWDSLRKFTPEGKRGGSRAAMK